MTKSSIKIFLEVIALTLILDFTSNFFEIKDLYIALSLILSTILLLLISDYKNASFNQNVIRVKSNLFLVAVIMSFMKLYSSIVYSINENTNINEISSALKPLIISLYIYLIFINVISRYKQNKNNLNEKITSHNIKDLDLTRREQEIFSLVLEGFTNKEIGEKLFIAETTVKKHIQNILKKANCNNRSELINKMSP